VNNSYYRSTATLLFSSVFRAAGTVGRVVGFWELSLAAIRDEKLSAFAEKETSVTLLLVARN